MKSPAAAVALVVLGGHLLAQEPRPTFQVISIKRLTSTASTTDRRPPLRPRGGLIDEAATVRDLIMFAYNLKRWQLTGGSAWTRLDQFAVVARAGRDVPVSEMRLMMQSLLEQRFALLVHEIQPEVPLYALVLARIDGRLGRGLKRDDGCTIKDEVLPGVPPTATSAFGCGSISALVDAVSTQVDSPVIDRTGLSGVYHWALYHSGPNMPSYRDALVQQLGLRLDTTRAPLKGLMIDSVRRPSED